jgi:hypothetical protein
MRGATLAVLWLLAMLAPSSSLHAATLLVGPTAPFRLPSQAVAAARSGDTIRIAAGYYSDCAVITQDGLTLEGAEGEAVLASKSCEDKGILVIAGRNVTVRNLTLRGARVPARNGAGIRAEGGNLRVEAARFIDNENGLLSAPDAAAEIHVIGSAFIGNGRCDPVCAHGLYVGAIGRLRIERSRFRDTHVGHHIKSRALRTEIVDCDIADGPDGTASYLIDIPNGGAVLVDSNRRRKGRRSDNPADAIMIGAEGVTNPTPSLIFRNNRFFNEQDRSTVFVNNRTATPALLQGNDLSGPVQPLSGLGTVR